MEMRAERSMMRASKGSGAEGGEGAEENARATTKSAN